MSIRVVQKICRNQLTTPRLSNKIAHMNCRSAVLILCLSFSFTSVALAGEKPWIEVRSPHFRVLTNGYPKDAKNIAHEFEQMRYVFTRLAPGFRLDSGAPMVIFAARDESTAKSLAPAVWKMKGTKPAGLFNHGWEKQYVMVRLDATGLNVHSIVYHEYTHSILHMNAHWLPTWLDEGMAEFYGYTRFQSDKMYIGAPTDRPLRLNRAPIPVETLLDVTRDSPYYHDPEKVEEFYVESWALVHYLTFGPGMGNGKGLNEFFRLLQQGVEQKKAFQQVFGSFADVNKNLDQYMMKFAFQASVLRDPPQIDEKDFSTHPLTLAETHAELAGYHLWNHDLTNARQLVQKALEEDPKLGMAHEEMGFLLFDDGKDAEAEQEFSQACALDKTLYLSIFAKTMLSPAATSDTTADEAAFHAALSNVLEVNPQFAPAFVQLARLSVRQNDLKAAFAFSRRAEELEPWRAGYHLLTGQILLRMGKGAAAATYAKYVADHWYGPDRDEAVELWNEIPAAQRPAGESVSEAALKNVQTVTGTVKSITCGGPGQRWTLVLNQNGRELTFHTKGFFGFGFSDTFWWGEDHFSSCRHYLGMRAIVRYQPSSDASYAGDVTEIWVRDDLPALAANTTGVAAVTSRQ